jgi:hypothetical protein
VTGAITLTQLHADMLRDFRALALLLTLDVAVLILWIGLVSTRRRP